MSSRLGGQRSGPALLGRQRKSRRMRRLAVVALVSFALGMWAPYAGSSMLRWPSFSMAGIRAWLTSADTSAGAPGQVLGGANGSTHQVPASVTRTHIKAAGILPGTAPGQLPAYQRYTPRAASGLSGTARAGFVPGKSVLEPGKSSATARVYRNPDGSTTVDQFTGVADYESSPGNWMPVDPTLVAGADGRWRERANSVHLGLGSSAVDPALVALGGQGGQSVSFGLAGAAPVPAAASGPQVTYAGALPQTDLEEAATPVGLKESLVLHSAAAPATFMFPLNLSGLTAVAGAGGSVSLVDAAGTAQMTIPPAVITDAARDPHSDLPVSQITVGWQLVPYNGGQALSLSLPAGWLSDPSRVFPVTVDPTAIWFYVDGSTYTQVGTLNANNSGQWLSKVGTYNNGSDVARTYLQFSSFGQYVPAGSQITSASLNLWDAWAWVCSVKEPVDSYAITSPWNVSSISYPGPSLGAFTGRFLWYAPSAACTNTSGSDTVGGYISVPFVSAGLNMLTGWSLGTTPNYGIAVRADNESDNNQWKQINSNTAAYNNPYLSVTYAPDIAPQINSVYPPSGQPAGSLTPVLHATARDPDNWPGNGLTYQFVVCSASDFSGCQNGSWSNVVATSTPGGPNTTGAGWVSSPGWQVPSGKLSWGRTYYWYALASDGYKAGASVGAALPVQVPQPTITSYAQNDGPQGVTPGSGAYTMSVTDTNVASPGPALSITRAYSSVNPGISAAFGQGWSSVLDMKVAPGVADTAGNVVTQNVTYPDGTQAGFGLNADGKTYSAPQGRYATLAAASPGPGYTLTDKNDTVYTFTESLGGGAYGITSITDALGNALSFTWAAGCPATAACEITQMTSAASGRSLHIGWSTATAPHVTSVATDPVTAGNQASALTWTYAYNANQLTGACTPASTASCAGQTACPSGGNCTGYTYTAGNDFPAAVLRSGPHSYWRLGDSAGAPQAASSAPLWEGMDNGNATAVSFGQPGPLPGSGATAASFDGASSYVALPQELASASSASVELWFNAAANSNGILLGGSGVDQPQYASGEATVPVLWVGTDEKLYGNMWTTGGSHQLSASGTVNDGKWHLAVLTASPTNLTLYLDGSRVASATTSALAMNVAPYLWLGAGPSNTGWNGLLTNGTDYYNGSIAEVATWDRPLTSAEVSALYHAATTAALISKVTRPSGSVSAQVAYNPATAAVTSVTDDHGGTWSPAAPAVTGTSQVYAASVLAQQPADYWRLSDGQYTTIAANLAGGGDAWYNNVTLGSTVTGPFADANAGSFDGASSYLQLPAADQVQTGPGSVEMWFQVPAGNTAGGVLWAEQGMTLGQPATSYTPALYVGPDGKLHGGLWTGSASNQIVSSSAVNDGRWHMVALTSSGTGEALYLDGAPIGTLAGAVVATSEPDVYVGAGHVTGWPDLPQNSDGYFTGSISDVAIFSTQLSLAQVTAAWHAAQSSTGLTPVETQTVTDPGGKTVSYKMDPVNGDRVTAQTDGLGNTTTFGYDTSGFQLSVTDPDGNTTTTGHDSRGNVVSRVTCQAAPACSTEYMTYYLNASNPADPQNDLMLTDAGPGSASATDPTRLTTYTYTGQGELQTETGPPVTGFPHGRTATFAYTLSSTPAYNSSGAPSGTTPPGLVLAKTTPGGAVTGYEYYSNGDVYQVTSPDGMRTTYAYDGVGRKLSQTEYSTAYPAGLTAAYAYDQLGQLITQTDPAVTDPVPGTPHTAQTTTTYDPDGDILSQTVADTTPAAQGGDPARTVTRTYDSLDQLATLTDGAGNKTTYTYDAYGNKASQSDPAGNKTTYTYDPDGSLLTQVLANYTGTATGPCQNVSGGLVESARSYDPAGQLASVTNANCDTTAYTYTGNGLVSTITKCSAWTNSTGCGGSTYTEQANTYNAANQLVTRVTGNGQTTTSYTPDAAGRNQSQTVDPAGLDRMTTYSYSPDDAVLTQRVSGPGSSPAVTSVTVQAWGGGGGGGGSNTTDTASSPGGGGGEYASQSVAVLPGTTYTVVVGSGGPGGAAGTNPGAAGGNSSFAASSAVVTAHGGRGGSTAASNSGGSGGTGSTTASHYNGAGGGIGSVTSIYRGGGGGGSGGTSSAGNAGAAGNTSGYGAAAVTGGGAGGNGGNAGQSTNGDGPGAAGSAPGGGGGGGEAYYATGEPGGNGAAGQVTLTWNGGSQTWTAPGTYQWTAPASSAVGLAAVTGYTYDPMGNLTSRTIHDDSPLLAPSGSWPLSAPAGTPAGSSAETYAPDQSGNGNTGILSAGASWASGGGVALDGNTGAVTASGPAVNTTGSYSVSAWVDLTGNAGNDQGIVAQSATNQAAYRLEYSSTSGTSGIWRFSLPAQDSTNPAIDIAASNTPAQLGTWTYLTGVYNAGSGQLTLYVNGAASGTATDTTPFVASGPVTIGAKKYNGSTAYFFDGTIANVQAYPYPLSASQVSQLYGEGRTGAPLGISAQTTSWALDSRGLPTAMTDPNGNTTSYVHDQAGQLASTTSPVVTTQVHGVGSLQVAPVSYTGYNTFGEPVLTKDPDGNQVFTSYDNDGRPVSVTEPDYAPPSGTGLISGAHTTTTYNSLSQVASQTDPLGNATSYTYDQLGDVLTKTTPAGATTYTYDGSGDELSATSPTGAATDATYDFVGRQVTSTQVERYPAAASYTTTTSYGANGTSPWVTKVTTPDGVVTSYGHDPAGEQTTVTDGVQDTTSYVYDAAGRLTKTTSPDNTSATTSYDEAGNPVGQAGYSSTGSLLRSDSATYDASGNQLTATDYRGSTSSFTYNAANQLTGEVQPQTSTTSVTTSFGYDAAGNPTLYTDGNGNNWWITYNSWNLPESKIEPATAAAPAAADSTFTTSYNADGNPVQVSEPGGITITDSYNTMQELTGQAGTGASAATAARTFGYNADGRLTSASAPGGTDTFTYNDRGQVLSASGPSGTSSFAYNGDGLTSSVTDAAGTTGYTYDSAGRLATLADPATGTTLSYGYNANSQVSQISYGTGADVQLYAYNGLHQLTSDTLQTAGGATVASIAYGYDPNGNLTSKNTTGFGATVSNSYSYNNANELTSWNNGTTTTNYAYDAAGNRTQAGTATYTYDARDELTSTGTSTLTYTKAGNLASVTGPGATTNYTSDAYGQTITAGSQTYAYDAIGRLVTGGTAAFSYDGTSQTLAADGTSTYTWNPGGASLVGIGVPGSQSTGTLALTDAHTDVVGNFSRSASSLTAAATYDPLGNLLTTSAMAGHLGYQSAWTDPATSQAHMGARWYNPATGQFTSRDRVQVKPEPNSAAANPFAYAADNPLTGTDPTGNMACFDSVCAGASQLARIVATQHTNTVNSQTQQAVNNSIGQCGTNARCGQTVIRNYNNPAYASPRIAQYANQQLARLISTLPAVGHAPSTPTAISDARASYISTPRFGLIGKFQDGSANIHLHGGWGSFWGGVGFGAVNLLDIANLLNPALSGLELATRNAFPLSGMYLRWMHRMHVATDGNSTFGLGIFAFATATAVGSEAAGTVSEIGATAPAAEDTSNLADAAATCGGMSFTASTKVLLASGLAVPIASLKAGDKVLATNVKTGKTSAETVTAVFVHHDTNRYDLRVQTPHGTAVIQTTSSHLIWNATIRRWVKAATLRYGSHISANANVLGGYVPANAAGWMWDLTVANDHDFYVKAVATNVLVHNCDVPDVIYRGVSGKSPSNFRLRPGEDALSFRDSLSNPLPPGRAVLLPGREYVGIDTSMLPEGSVVPDGVAGSDVTPPGHVSVYLDNPQLIKLAIIEYGRFP